MKCKLTTFFSIIILFGCSQSHNETKEERLKRQKVEKEQKFEEYLDLFRDSKLPLQIRGCVDEFDGLPIFKNSEYKEYLDEYSTPYLTFRTKGNNISTLTLSAADCYVPILTTYRPNGKKIDEKPLSIGYCGGDCGYTCNEYLEIKKDYSIYVSDTITSYECDSIGEEIPNTKESYIIYKTGRILKSGRIELTKEKRKEL